VFTAIIQNQPEQSELTRTRTNRKESSFEYISEYMETLYVLNKDMHSGSI